MHKAIFAVMLVLLTVGCQAVETDSEEVTEAESEGWVSEDPGREVDPDRPVFTMKNDGYPEGAYVTHIPPFFDDSTCKGSMAWGLYIQPKDKGLFFMVVTTDTEPPMIHYPSGDTIPGGPGYGLNPNTGECEQISSIIKPPGGAWLRWNHVALADFPQP